jgi:hypothetical protein
MKAQHYLKEAELADRRGDYKRRAAMQYRYMLTSNLWDGYWNGRIELAYVWLTLAIFWRNQSR